MTSSKEIQTVARAAGIVSRKHGTARPGNRPTRAQGAAVAAFATLAMPLALHAQTSAPANSQANPQALPEVTIEGQRAASDFQVKKSANEKFTMPLLDTPKAVTVITADVISQTGAVSLADALRTVPGITIGAGEGGNPVGDNLFIRGYNAQTDTYIDGIRHGFAIA